MNVLVCGSRFLTWTDHAKAMQARLEQLPKPWTLIHGAASGADGIAAIIASSMGVPAIAFPADWAFGKFAGPDRNQRMLNEGKPHLVLAFHYDIGLGKGTADMVRRARAAGVPVEVTILPVPWLPLP